MISSHENPAFVNDHGYQNNYNSSQSRYPALPALPDISQTNVEANNAAIPPHDRGKMKPERDTWGKGIEFLMSCIAMSVGLGNVWRFPFTALDNGGGAFLIPYLVVLFLVGKPIYYLEMIIGQFSSRGSVKVFDLCPAMRGIGIGQIVSISIVTTYYVAIMGMTMKYFIDSFFNPLPWSECQDSWNAVCVASSDKNTARLLYNVTVDSNITNSIVTHNITKPTSSAELYFINEVLKEKDNIDDGIGMPNWQLVLGLFVSWLCVFGIIMRGVKSSGKASYFLAIFPYIVMLILLGRAVTLPGSFDGILFFIKPDWSRILDPKVWYAAVTQCFYSLSVCFGNIVMYASYNKFDHNVYRDATIVTGLDTCTSLLAGFTIFGILGHLAHEIGTDDIGSVVKGGAGLAFISYPDAIAKFQHLPQIFSVLFFLMLFVLGIGSNIAMTSCSVTAMRDKFPNIKQWHCALGLAIFSFIIGLAYVTPGGQFILTLVDYYGASMIALVLGIFELYTLGWVYGVDRICKDAEFMLGRKVGIYWRLCWAVITPLIMTVILIYFLSTYTPLTYNNVQYPNWAYALGWCITAIGVLQLPLWLIMAVINCPNGDTWSEKFVNAFKPKHDWGPSDASLFEQYCKEIENSNPHGMDNNYNYNDNNNSNININHNNHNNNNNNHNNRNIKHKNCNCWAYIKQNIFG